MSTKPADLSGDYYAFDNYVTRARWLTYHEQLRLILATRPHRILEVGVGPGLLRSFLSHLGCEVVTVDVNRSLKPDVVADLRALPETVTERTWDWVVCSRVLHHLPMAELPSALDALARLQFGSILLTLPREDLSLQVNWRRTAGSTHSFRVSGGARLKRILRRRMIQSEPSGVWMLNGRNSPTDKQVRGSLGSRFSVESEFILTDDPSHMFYVLGRR